MSTFIGVMHAAFDETRKASLSSLVEALGDIKAPHVLHIERDTERLGAWEVARRCWNKGVFSGCSNVIVMNDDALPCAHFIEAASRAIEARPNSPVCFFTSSPKMDVKTSFATSNGGLVGVACGMRADVADEFTRFAASYFRSDVKMSDDNRVNYFAMVTDRKIYTTVPSLVDHQLPADSLVGTPVTDIRTPVVPPSGDASLVDYLTGGETHIGNVRSNHWRLPWVIEPAAWAKLGIIECMYAIDRDHA